MIGKSVAALLARPGVRSARAGFLKVSRRIRRSSMFKSRRVRYGTAAAVVGGGYVAHRRSRKRALIKGAKVGYIIGRRSVPQPAK